MSAGGEIYGLLFILSGARLNRRSRMEAEATLLTHFSQRYPKIPVLKGARPPVVTDQSAADTRVSPTPASGGEFYNKGGTEPVVALAFDCASIPIGSMWKLSRYKPALERLFAELEEPERRDDEEAALRAASMGRAPKPLGSAAEVSSKPESDKKVRAGNEEVLSTKKPAKKQKVSPTRSRAVG